MSIEHIIFTEDQACPETISAQYPTEGYDAMRLRMAFEEISEGSIRLIVEVRSLVEVRWTPICEIPLDTPSEDIWQIVMRPDYPDGHAKRMDGPESRTECLKSAVPAGELRVRLQVDDPTLLVTATLELFRSTALAK